MPRLVGARVRRLAGMVCLAAVALTGGCSADGPGPPALAVTDSAGTRTLTYDLSDASVPIFRHVVEHDLEIGEQAGAPEYAFSRIVDVAVADDGTIVVSDGVSTELRTYGPDGRYLRTLSGPGEGPGELASPATVADLAGDTVFAFDDRSSRVTSFALSGELLDVGTFRSDDIGRPRGMIRLDDGSYLSMSRWVAPGQPQRLQSYDIRLELDSLVVERVAPGGALLDTLRVMPDRTRLRSIDVGSGGMVRLRQADPPYATQTHVASDGARLVTGRTDAFDLEVMDPDGGPTTVIRVLGAKHPATAADIHAHQEARLREDLGEGEIPAEVRQLYLDHLPDRLPAFGSLLVSRDGDLWVSRSALDTDDGLDWLVFSPEGELRGAVHTPPGLELRAVTAEYLVGFVLDDLDVPYVRRYPLRADGVDGG